MLNQVYIPKKIPGWLLIPKATLRESKSFIRGVKAKVFCKSREGRACCSWTAKHQSCKELLSELFPGIQHSNGSPKARFWELWNRTHMAALQSPCRSLCIILRLRNKETAKLRRSSSSSKQSLSLAAIAYSPLLQTLTENLSLHTIHPLPQTQAHVFGDSRASSQNTKLHQQQHQELQIPTPGTGAALPRHFAESFHG